MFKRRDLGITNMLGDDIMSRTKRLRHIHFWTNERAAFSEEMIDQRVSEALSINKILR